MARKKYEPHGKSLQAGDYYLNAAGLLVFTEQYHLRRGYCCNSGCKHCPFRKNTNKEEEFRRK